MKRTKQKKNKILRNKKFNKQTQSMRVVTAIEKTYPHNSGIHKIKKIKWKDTHTKTKIQGQIYHDIWSSRTKKNKTATLHLKRHIPQNE